MSSTPPRPKPPAPPAGKEPIPGWVEPRPDKAVLDLASITGRLAAAERQIQSTKLVAGLVVGVSTVVAIGATLLTSTRASQATVEGTGIKAPFRIVDDQGHVLLQVASEQGGPQLRLFDTSQRMVAALGAGDEGGSLSVVGRAGSTATLEAGDAGGHLTVSDGKSRPAAWIGARQEGGQLTCWTPSGREALILTARERGGSLMLTDQKGATRTLGFAGASSSRLAVVDGEGLPAGELPRDRAIESPPSRRPKTELGNREVTSSVPPQYARASGSQTTRSRPARAAHGRQKIAKAKTLRSGAWQRQQVWCQRLHRRGRFPAGGHWHSRWVRRGPTPARRLAGLPRISGAQARQGRARQKALSKRQLRIAAKLLDLAREYRLLSSPVGAEFFYRKALSTYRGALGENHRLVAGTLQEIAGFYRGRGRPAEAEKAYRQALTAYLRCLGPNHVRVAACQRGLATFYREQRRYTEAQALYRRALTCYQKVLSPNAPEVAATRKSYIAVQQRIKPSRAREVSTQSSIPPVASSASSIGVTPQAAGTPPAAGVTPGRPVLSPDRQEY